MDKDKNNRQLNLLSDGRNDAKLDEARINSNQSQQNNREEEIKNELENEDIDVDQFLDPLDEPGSIQKAKQHHLATKIFDYSKLEKMDDLCDDCYCPIPPDKDNIPRFNYCDNTLKLAPFGVGVYLYFFFIKFLVFILFVLMILNGIPQMIINWQSKQDLRFYCEKNFSKDTICVNFLFVNRTKQEKKKANITLEIENLVWLDYTTEGQKNTNKYINSTLNCTAALDLIDGNCTLKRRDLDYLWSFNYENIKFKEKIIHNNKKATSSDDPVVDITVCNFISEIVLVVINSIFMLIAYNLELEADIKLITPEDFTLRISGVPTHLDQNELIEELSFGEIKVLEVNRTYQLNKFFEDKEQYKTLRKKFAQLVSSKKDYIDGFCGKKITKKQILNELKECDIKLGNYIEEVEKEGNKFINDSVFIVFKDSFDKTKYENFFPTSILEYLFDFIKLTLYTTCQCCSTERSRKILKNKFRFNCNKASEPTDIIWENIEYTNLNRYFRTFIIYLVTFLILFGSFWILWAINIAQANMNQYSDKVLYAISFGFSMAVVLINTILKIALNFLTKLEKNISYSDYYLSYSYKLMLATWANTALIPIAVAYFNEQWRNKGLLINNAFVIFLTNSIVTPLVILIDIPYYVKSFARWRLINKYEVKGEPMIHTQGELNQ